MDGREVIKVMPLYKAVVRPHYEYGVRFSAPLHKKYIIELEKGQRRALKLIKGIDNLIYDVRLTKLDLFTLAKRHLRGDMITIYKYIRDIEGTFKITNNPKGSTNDTGSYLKVGGKQISLATKERVLYSNSS